MKGIRKMGKVVCGVLVGGLVSAGSAFAAVDLTGVELDTTTPETLAATIVTGLGVIWGIRKIIKLVNRS